MKIWETLLPISYIFLLLPIVLKITHLPYHGQCLDLYLELIFCRIFIFP